MSVPRLIELQSAAIAFSTKITGVVAEAVVNRLEVIDIERQQR
jgi:hypothetical protein